MRKYSDICCDEFDCSDNQDTHCDHKCHGNRVTLKVPSSYSNNYNTLTYKPTINGITLVGNLTTADIGIIDDNRISAGTTYSSQKINSLITSSIEGSSEEPIVLDSLQSGKYVIEGYVQATETSEGMEVPLKTYIVIEDEGSYVLWDGNPYAASQYYIIFSKEDGIAPQEKVLELVTKETLVEAEFDCGTFTTEK